MPPSVMPYPDRVVGLEATLAKVGAIVTGVTAVTRPLASVVNCGTLGSRAVGASGPSSGKIASHQGAEGGGTSRAIGGDERGIGCLGSQRSAQGASARQGATSDREHGRERQADASDGPKLVTGKSSIHPRK